MHQQNCVIEIHDNSHHCLGTMFIVWFYDFNSHAHNFNGPNNDAVNFVKKTFIGTIRFLLPNK